MSPEGETRVCCSHRLLTVRTVEIDQRARPSTRYPKMPKVSLRISKLMTLTTERRRNVLADIADRMEEGVDGWVSD